MKVVLKHATIVADERTRTVTTYFSNGGVCYGTRDDTPENRREAIDEGYADGDVWRCLVEHEVAHSFIPQEMWNEPSPALITETGTVPAASYQKRLYEESLVIAFQRYCNTGRIDQQLEPFVDRLPDWRGAFKGLLYYAGATWNTVKPNE